MVLVVKDIIVIFRKPVLSKNVVLISLCNSHCYISFQQLWTNEPILEFCPKTKMKILPMYMTRRGSSTSSFHSHGSEDSVANMSSSSFK